MEKFNFYAGPAIIYPEVIKQTADAVNNFNGTGLSIMEVSHRSKEVVEVMEEAEQSVIDLLNLPSNYKVLFLSGGASSQFFMSALNLLDPEKSAGYIDTGSWSSKAIKEAKKFGDIKILASSKDKNYNYIPKDFEVSTDLSYLHLTSNNTIFGSQFHSFPQTKVPLVVDMSSDIFHKPLENIERFGLIYAGAQKNLGPAGTTLVIINEDLLGKVNRDLPTMLDYRTHISKKSSFNTPPVLPIYVCMLSLRALKSKGLDKVYTVNSEKASVVYNAIDRNSLFSGVVEKSDRSLMNITFTLKNADLESEFLDNCEAAGCIGLKGHRSVGGFRASIYNAMSIEGVNTLASVMDDFQSKFG